MLPGSWMLFPRRTHPQNKFYDDRLITDAASLEDHFKGADGVEYKVSIHIPKILSEDAQAQELNQRIMDIWGNLPKKTKDE